MFPVRRSLVERILIAVVLLSVLGGSIALYAQRTSVTQQQLMINELAGLRNLIGAYYAERHVYPPSLEVFGAAAGERVDPYGMAYDYDPSTGWVRSASQRHEQW